MPSKTFLITGASRGIGRAIALRAAQEGANIAILAKTKDAHPKLPGTIYTVAKEVEFAGGQALPLSVDLRNADEVAEAVAATVKKFGGIDVLVNNASAITLTDTLATEMKRFDLMLQINMRGSFACAKFCLPHLLKASNPHILMLAPPLNLEPQSFQHHLAYTLSKYGMSLCVMGMAAEFKGRVAVNALWPKYLVSTSATNFLAATLPGIDPRRFRHAEIVAEAACLILGQPIEAATGHFYLDEEVLAAAGITNFNQYAIDPSVPPIPDLFLVPEAKE